MIYFISVANNLLRPGLDDGATLLSVTEFNALSFQ